jgi:hypothetical protein
MHEDELEMPEPDESTSRSHRFRIAKLLAASAAVAALGIVGATVAWADSAGTSGTNSQVGQSSVDTQNAGQNAGTGADCPFKSGSQTSSAVGARG